MTETHTTAVVQRYLNELNDLPTNTPAEKLVRDLLTQSVNRLELLCGTMLHRSYPRLTQPPLNLQTEEVLSAVVERLLKALKQVRPEGVRQFFALANQHIRWELNDLARHFDEQSAAQNLSEALPAYESSDSGLSPNAQRILAAIENLPEPEREVFSLVRIQGLSHNEVAQLLDISTKTVQRRLNACLIQLTALLESE